MDYGFAHDGKVFTPNGSTVSPTENDARNAAIEAAELERWKAQPETMLAYYHFQDEQRTSRPYRRPYLESFYPPLNGAHVAVWRGAWIGTIVSARVYRHNFGARMVSMRVRGTNGAMYYGRASWDCGTCITLHKSKGGK